MTAFPEDFDAGWAAAYLKRVRRRLSRWDGADAPADVVDRCVRDIADLAEWCARFDNALAAEVARTCEDGAAGHPCLLCGVGRRGVTGRLLTVADVARRWGVSERHVRRLTASGRLPCVKIGRTVRFRLDAVDDWERGGGRRRRGTCEAARRA